MDGELSDFTCCRDIQNQVQTVLLSAKNGDTEWFDPIDMSNYPGWEGALLKIGAGKGRIFITVVKSGKYDSIIPSVVEGDVQTHPYYTEEEIYRMEPTHLDEVMGGTDIKTSILIYIGTVCGISANEVQEYLYDDGKFLCKWVEPHFKPEYVRGYFSDHLLLEGIESCL